MAYKVKGRGGFKVNKKQVAQELIKMAKRLIAFTPEEIDYGSNGPKTLWGKADFGYKLDKGVTWYTTPSHGGLAVAGGVAKRFLTPEAIKQGETRGGYVWFEEDIAYVVAFLENPKWEKALTRLAGGSVMSPSKKIKMIERWMPEYLGLTKEEEPDDNTVTIRVNSALQTLVSGVVAGYTSNDHVIIFLSDDYDGRGNVRGPYEDITKIVGDAGWSLICNKYSDDALEELGWTSQQQIKQLGYLKKFKSKHRASKTKTSAIKSPYYDIILALLKRAGRKNIDPRHVEAYLRESFRTLDNLNSSRMLREIKDIIPVIDDDPKMAEMLAKTYGL